MQKIVILTNPENEVEKQVYSTIYDIYNMSNMLLSIKNLDNKLHIRFLDTEVRAESNTDPIYIAFNNLLKLLENPDKKELGYYLVEVNDGVYELRNIESNIRMVISGVYLDGNTLAVTRLDNPKLEMLFGVDLNLVLTTNAEKINSLIYHILNK